MTSHFTKNIHVGVAAALLAVGSSASAATITAFDTPATETFNGLATTGTSSTPPSGISFVENGTASNGTYTAGTGSLGTGDTYSFGATNSADRAFGGIQSGNLVPAVAVLFTNATGATINTVSVTYIGEQWRLGTAGRADRLDASYSTTATTASLTDYTTFDMLDFSSPVTTGTLGALDGNAAANRAAVTAMISGLSIPNNGTLLFNFTDFNASGADDGLALEDFSVTAISVIPEPMVAGPATLTLGAIVLRRRRAALA